MSEKQYFIVLFQMIQALTSNTSNAIPVKKLIESFDRERSPFFLGNYHRSKALIAEIEYAKTSDKSTSEAVSLLNEAFEQAELSLKAYDSVPNLALNKPCTAANYGKALAKFLLGQLYKK